MNVRIKFSKSGSAKFVGHLDMMRYFQKAMRRAGIDIKYSEGFSPHQILSFAAPLGVGVTSEGEYIDIEVGSLVSSQAAIDALNSVMAENISVLQYRLLPDNVKNAMASVAGAKYKVSYKKQPADGISLESILKYKKEWFDDADSINVIKKTKKNETEIDLKPLIFEWDMTAENDAPCFLLTLSSGSAANIKPEFMLENFYKACGFDYNPLDFQIHRIDTLTLENDTLISLGDIGKDID